MQSNYRRPVPSTGSAMEKEKVRVRTPMSEDTKEKMRIAQQARRRREADARLAEVAAWLAAEADAKRAASRPPPPPPPPPMRRSSSSEQGRQLLQDALFQFGATNFDTIQYQFTNLDPEDAKMLETFAIEKDLPITIWCKPHKNRTVAIKDKNTTRYELANLSVENAAELEHFAAINKIDYAKFERARTERGSSTAL